MNKTSWSVLTDYSLAVLCGLFWLGVLYRVVRYPAPHTALNVLWLIPFFACSAAYGVWSGQRLSLWTGLASVLGVWLLYQFNILVPYEVWLKRGMPPRPF